MQWPATQELYQAEEQFAGQPMRQERQVAAVRAEHTTIFEWRATMPADLSEPRECVVQPLLRSQTLEGIPENFGQLSVSSLSQHPPASQAVWSWPNQSSPFQARGT